MNIKYLKAKTNSSKILCRMVLSFRFWSLEYTDRPGQSLYEMLQGRGWQEKKSGVSGEKSRGYGHITSSKMLATMSANIVICSFDLPRVIQRGRWDARVDLQEVSNLELNWQSNVWP